ncbi:amino acid permease [Rudaeicoccus suwonensis]|uniref:Amino acid/polyamine/organocation transporter (APC superfamily) n=1 Tax=Rudaeicoccus suwonensis TaxID=657409 RepID=A0A561E9D7_9MICO|nr:amino acid permease [Rudaeicoccus suwonensis]TWE12197.1 amino acid/polyamine/organocation transporter (APC superfamily) [Rudaeicoccus suwonensis]
MDQTSTGSDEDLLAELGYKQELHRGMSAFSNFAVSFSIISILAGCITTYGLAMGGGGPIAITIGWPICAIAVMCVAMAMAEICSVYPTSGGLYFWAGRLARKRKREWAWYTGWFNFLGEVGVTASVDYGAAITWMAFASELWGVDVTPKKTFFLFLVFILIHGLLNTFGVNVVKILSSVSAWWHLAGVAVIVVVLAFVPSHHKSLGYTFGHFNDSLGFSHGLFSTPLYAFFIGLLMSQYTLTGYDASAHLAEETHDASREAPKGIVRSVWVSAIAGWLLLIAVTASIQNFGRELTATRTGLPAAEIFIDAAGHSLGVSLIFICGVAQFFCGMACVTSNSRMSYAFSRDGALPGSALWAKVNPRTGTPTNSIWLCVVCSIALTIPAYWNTTAFNAVVSIAVIGLYIAYTIPIFLRRMNPSFRVGRWHLGKWSPLIGWVSVVWVIFIVIMFMLPQAAPGTFGNKTFNYAPVAVVIVLVFATAMWIFGGRSHFMRDVPAGHETKDAAEIFGD